MKSIAHMMVAAALVAGALAGVGQSPATQTLPTNTLKIYLPREVVVEGERIDLGAVGVVRGDDAAVKRAAAVAVARFSVAGQQIVVDRATILAMLASAGIDTAAVTITGAEQVTLRRNEDVIAPERFLAVARAFLEEKLKGKPVTIVPISRPKPWIMPKAAGDVRLVAKEHPYSIPSRPRVWVEAVVGDQVQTACEVAFSLRYRHQQVVATADIAEGDILSKENVKLETVETSYPPAPETPPPFGMVAKRAIRKGTVVRDALASPEVPPALVKRRQAVIVRLETPFLLVSSTGEAMDDGKSGDVIRVRVNNGKDAKIIVTRIGDDGTVTPVI